MVKFRTENKREKYCEDCRDKFLEGKLLEATPADLQRWLLESKLDNQRLRERLLENIKSKQAALARAFAAEDQIYAQRESAKSEFDALVSTIEKFPMPECNGVMKLTRWERFKNRLFPGVWVQGPDAPAEFEDVLVQQVTIAFSFLDLLRLIASRRLLVEFRTATRNKIGAQKSTSGACVLAPKWMEGK
jgi:hypothetical protein